MFELHSSFDLLVSVYQFIHSYRQGASTLEPIVINPRIINQEKGGGILFVWNDVDKEQPASIVTNFGIYELETQKHSVTEGGDRWGWVCPKCNEVIYTYEKKVTVVSCSVNPERTLLAFSIVKPQEAAAEKKSKDVYQGYLAELQSVGKTVFSLNMERSTFLKVQFVYHDQQRQSHNKESEMLVFLHKESIGLYKVSMGRIGDKGIIMSGQPKTEQVVRKFVWCQWDSVQNRLHYIENVRNSSNSDHQPTQKMSTMQFKGLGKYENMIDIPINFPFPYIRTADKPHYGDIPLHPGIPELTLNLAVLTQPSGAFCLCYHKQIKSKSTKQGASASQDVEYYISMIHHGKPVGLIGLWNKGHLSKLSRIYNYSTEHPSVSSQPPCLLYCHTKTVKNILCPYFPSRSLCSLPAKTLYGCVSNVPKDIATQKRLVFSWLGSYLVVMLPGYFVHLLNVSPSYEPCHHILLHDSHLKHLSAADGERTSATEKTRKEEREREREESIQRSFQKSSSVVSFTSSYADMSSTASSPLYVIPVFSDKCLSMKTLLPCQSFIRESGSTAQHLYDYRSGCLMKLVLNIDSMVDSFRNAYWQTQLAILHYLILHNKDALAVKKLFEVIIEYISDSEVNSMFYEYLVASTFAEMKKQVNKEILNLLSFTFTQTLRGQVEKNETGQRIAHILYNSLETINLNKKWTKDSKSSTNEDFWDVLFRRLRLRNSQVHPRFSHDEVMSMYRQAEMEEAAGKSMWNPMHVDDSFFDEVFALKLTEKPTAKTVLDHTTSQEEGASGGRSKLDNTLGPAPLFLQTHVQHSKIFKRRLSMLTKELLTKHLTKHLSKESQSKAQNVASEYLYCQAKVSRQLCHLIWSLRGQNISCQKSFLPNLQEPGTDEEYELFQLYERFYLTTGDLGFPLPPNFSSFFTSLGIKCLELHLFFQYVDRYILTLTPDFILQLLEDLPDDADEEIPVIKFQVISRLPKPIAEECFERWNHPITQQRKAREQVTQILLQGLQPSTAQQLTEQEKGRRGKEINSRYSRSSPEESKTFPPLDTFMKHLDSVVSNMTPGRPISYDTKLIESVALFNTKTKTSFDLSTVNF